MGIYDNERDAKVNTPQSRNQERVLSEAMINDIKSAMYTDLRMNNEEIWAVVDAMMHSYLADDFESFKEFTTMIVEGYEDDIIATLNMEIREDLENQNENHA